jgi:predicted RecB family nuclease
VTKPKPKPKVEPKPELIPEPKKPTEPSVTESTSVNQVKGIGEAAFDKLSSAGIKTIGDLLKKHSQEIATMIGRKSDSQIKKWQENARAMLE